MAGATRESSGTVEHWIEQTWWKSNGVLLLHLRRARKLARLGKGPDVICGFSRFSPARIDSGARLANIGDFTTDGRVHRNTPRAEEEQHT